MGEESPQGRRGRNIPRETCTLYFTFEPAAPSERVLHEFAYNPVPVGFNALPRERKYPCFVLPVAPQGAIIKVPNIHVMRDARQKMIT